MKPHVLFCLVVDDEPLAQLVIENYISRLNRYMLVAKCESIQEAVNILNQKKIDILFLDLDLKSSSGLELIDELKSMSLNPYYVIITSATSARDFKSQNYFTTTNVRFVDYLTKPFSFERFLAAISKITEFPALE